ncbi:hypothetical protein QR98_0104450 [Sarcoptes scabiei]|uniref:Uncharacterized protein n=1 Tax=Sarcoptes scabiei TaxID=52283 RepID=A0A132ALI8_SARSC|nr:hypothetical protein QR98_0104450 [Sarcoptes scabiei]
MLLLQNKASAFVVIILAIVIHCQGQNVWHRYQFRSVANAEEFEKLANQTRNTVTTVLTNPSTISTNVQPNATTLSNEVQSISGESPNMMVTGRIAAPVHNQYQQAFNVPQPMSQSYFRSFPANATIQMRGPTSSWRMAVPQAQTIHQQPILSTLVNQTFPVANLSETSPNGKDETSNASKDSIENGQLPQEFKTDTRIAQQSSTPTSNEQEPAEVPKNSEPKVEKEISEESSMRSFLDFFGKSKEKEYEDVDEHDFESEKDKFFSKFDGKKSELKKNFEKIKPAEKEYDTKDGSYDSSKGKKLSVKLKADEYDDDGDHELILKPAGKKLGKKLGKLGKEKLVLEEEHLASLPVAAIQPPAAVAIPIPVPVAGYTPPAQPVAYPTAAYSGHYQMDPYPKGKYIPQYRQANVTVATESTATLEESALNARSLTQSNVSSGATPNPTQTSTDVVNQSNDSNNRMKIFQSSMMQKSPMMDLNSHSDAYGAEIYQLNPTSRAYSPLAAGTAALAATAYPPPTVAYPSQPPMMLTSVPAYSQPAYPGAAAAAAPSAAYPPPPVATPVLSPSPSYSSILSKVLSQIPTVPYVQQVAANYSAKYDYSMPVGVVNLFCTNLKLPCSCTLYITEINQYNMLISGVCSGLAKEQYYMLNLYEFGDITSGCAGLGLPFAPPLPAGGYRRSNYMSNNLGIIKSDYSGVAFVNKLKHDSLSVMCDKYSGKTSILGRALGLSELSPLSAVPLTLPTYSQAAAALSLQPTKISNPPLVGSLYRRSAPAYPLPMAPAYPSPLAALPNLAPSFSALPSMPTPIACGVIGLANKDNSYETRHIKSQLIAHAELEEENARKKKEPY